MLRQLFHKVERSMVGIYAAINHTIEHHPPSVGLSQALPFHPCMLQESRASSAATETPRGLKLMTYNINNQQWSKQYDLQCLLQHTQCNVVALQEMLLCPTNWTLAMHGYQCI